MATATKTAPRKPETAPMTPAVQENGALAVAAAGDDIFNAVANSGKYLPRLQMFGGNSEPVKEGKVPLASYALVTGKDVYQPLGSTVDLVAIAWRPKAMDVSGDDVINVHDHTDPEFARIQAASEIQDSGCMFGPEFLLYVPAIKKFATLFMSSKTARREAPAVRERLPIVTVDGRQVYTDDLVGTTLAVNYIKTTKYSWHAIVVKPCSTPFDFPEKSAVAEERNKFLNPPKVDIERAPETTTTRAR